MSRIESKRLAIYYAYPSGVNGTFSVPGAINVFKDYYLLVFGSGLEEVAHPDHANTVAIIAGLTNTKVYGYVDATISLVDFKDKVDKWSVMGVAGIFCDRFGYDFGFEEKGLSAGAGFQVMGIRVDYAFTQLDFFDAVHMFSVSYGMK